MSVVLLTLAVAAFPAGFSAKAEQNHFYLKADAGGTLASDVQLREFYGPVAPGSIIKLDPGVRLGFRGGYGVTDWFDAEVETGFSANRVDSITGATQVKASLANVPFMLNARFHCPKLDRFSPYFGGGLGVSSVILTGDDIVIGATRMHGSTAGVAFGYQAFAGLRYAINDRMGVSVEYHYFATTSSHSHADIAVGTTSDRLSLGGTESHAFSAAFDFKF